jgi:hypothetical protein
MDVPKAIKPQMSRTKAIPEPPFPEVWQANRNGLPNGEMILYVDSTDDESQETGGSRKIVKSKAEDLDIVRCAHGVVCEDVSLVERRRLVCGMVDGGGEGESSGFWMPGQLFECQ